MSPGRHGAGGEIRGVQASQSTGGGLKASLQAARVTEPRPVLDVNCRANGLKSAEAGGGVLDDV